MRRCSQGVHFLQLSRSMATQLNILAHSKENLSRLNESERLLPRLLWFIRGGLSLFSSKSLESLGSAFCGSINWKRFSTFALSTIILSSSSDCSCWLYAEYGSSSSVIPLPGAKLSWKNPEKIMKGVSYLQNTWQRNGITFPWTLDIISFLIGRLFPCHWTTWVIRRCEHSVEHLNIYSIFSVLGERKINWFKWKITWLFEISNILLVVFQILSSNHSIRNSAKMKSSAVLLWQNQAIMQSSGKNTKNRILLGVWRKHFIFGSFLLPVSGGLK